MGTAELMTVLTVAATALIAYFLGCINGSILTSRLVFGDDIREHGSGNAGLTNFYRTYGTKGVIGVLASDILKAIIAVAVGGFLFGHFLGMSMVGKLLATIFVLLGHMYPVTFKFHGGKGILSGVSALLLVDWRLAVLAVGVFLALVLLTRYVSLGSVCSVISFMIGFWLLYHDVGLEILGCIAGVLVIFAHRDNIVRLIHGTENKFSLHKKGDGSK